VTRRAAALAALLALAGLLACGKYGPPVRAGEEEKPAPKPTLEIPLPSTTGPSEPATEPGEPPVEQEPPPEGAP
jgi:hypothetical protein